MTVFPLIVAVVCLAYSAAAAVFLFRRRQPGKELLPLRVHIREPTPVEMAAFRKTGRWPAEQRELGGQ